jgi:hypothetical protein
MKKNDVPEVGALISHSCQFRLGDLSSLARLDHLLLLAVLVPEIGGHDAGSGDRSANKAHVDLHREGTMSLRTSMRYRVTYAETWAEVGCIFGGEDTRGDPTRIMSHGALVLKEEERTFRTCLQCRPGYQSRRCALSFRQPTSPCQQLHRGAKDELLTLLVRIVTTLGKPEYAPLAAKKVAKYRTPGLVAMCKIPYPMSETEMHPMTKGPRSFRRSEAKATRTTMQAENA